MTQGLFDEVFAVITITLGPKPCVNIFLNLLLFVSDLMFSGRVFNFCGTKAVRLSVPYLVVLFLTIRWFGRTLGLINFKGKNIFHKGRV